MVQFISIANVLNYDLLCNVILLFVFVFVFCYFILLCCVFFVFLFFVLLLMINFYRLIKDKKNYIESQPLELLWCPSSWHQLIKLSFLDVTSDFAIRPLKRNNSAWKPLKYRRAKSIIWPFCHRNSKISTVGRKYICFTKRPEVPLLVKL